MLAFPLLHLTTNLLTAEIGGSLSHLISHWLTFLTIVITLVYHLNPKGSGRLLFRQGGIDVGISIRSTPSWQEGMEA